MSSQNVYIGAYFTIREEAATSEVDHCATHERPDGADFCPKCGRNRAARLTCATRYASSEGFWTHEKWVDRLVSVLSKGGVTRAISNLGSCEAGQWIDDETGVWPMPDEAGCRAALESEHAAEGFWLRHLGCEVTIDFGVLGWWS